MSSRNAKLGQPTKLCPVCNGSGCPAGELQRIMNGGPIQGPARCGYCAGSGRVFDPDAAKAASSSDGSQQ